MKRCSSCNTEIKDNDKTVKCQLCSNEIHRDCAINDGGTFCDVCYVNKNTISEAKREYDIPKVIRRSHIETYKTCPFKFFQEVIQGNPMPDNIYTRLGIDLHELFERGSRDSEFNQNLMLEEFEKLFANYPKTLFADDKQRENMYTRGIDSIETFYHVIADMPEAYDVEVKTEFSVGKNLPKVSATFDRINLVDGELEVIDWKTGNVLVGKKLSSDLQAPIYIHGVKETYGLPVRKFTFYYLKDNKVRVYERTENPNEYVCQVGKRKYIINIEDMIKEVQKLFSQIMNHNWNIPMDTRKMYFPCKMCHIKEQGLCDGADIQIWRQINQ
jgi:hypothetical protein